MGGTAHNPLYAGLHRLQAGMAAQRPEEACAVYSLVPAEAGGCAALRPFLKGVGCLLTDLLGWGACRLWQRRSGARRLPPRRATPSPALAGGRALQPSRAGVPNGARRRPSSRTGRSSTLSGRLSMMTRSRAAGECTTTGDCMRTCRFAGCHASLCARCDNSLQLSAAGCCLACLLRLLHD